MSRDSVSRELLDAVLARSPEAVFIADDAGRCQSVNARWSELTGSAPESVLDDGWMSLVHPEDRAEFVGAWWIAVQGEDEFRQSCRMIRPDGTEATVHASASRVRDRRGFTVAWLGRLQLVTGEAGTWAAARDLHDKGRFEQAFDLSPIGMALTTLEGQYVRVNQAMCDLLGLTREDLLDTSVLETTHSEDLQQTVDAAVELLDGLTPSFSLEKRFVNSRGMPVWTRATTTLLHAADGTPRHFLTQVENIEERRQLMKRLHHAAVHDPLTGLANRAGLDEFILALQPNETVGVIAIDLDRFKRVNDTEGHAAGDEVLRTVARRISDCARRLDHAARTGGDEFVLLCSDAASEADLSVLAQRLVDSLSEPIDVGGVEVAVGASAGVAFGLARDLPELRIQADEASYRAKRSGDAVSVVADSLS